MSLVPIPNIGDIRNDPFYRYKRSLLQINKVGQFNIISNFRQVCRQLDIKKPNQEKDLVDYFKKNLKQQVIYEAERGTIKVKSFPIDPEEILEEYIKKYIICVTCGYPELGDNRVCRSCGTSN